MDMNSTAELASAVSSVLKRTCAVRQNSQILRLADMLTTETVKAVSDYGFACCKSDEVDSQVRATIWWASQALKKHRGLGVFDADRLSSEAKISFLQRNSAVKGQRLWWPLVDDVRALLREALPPVDPSVAEARFGPGAVAEGLDSIQRWRLLEDCDFDPRNPSYIPGSAPGYDGGLLEEPYTGSFTHIPTLAPFDKRRDVAARLVAVPKDAWRMRLISVEPGRNAFLQQFVRSLLLESIHRGSLKGSPSDFLAYSDNVEIQQRRCILSSERLHTSTIDLKDASDWISAEDVFCLFPSWVLPWLEMSRTPYVKPNLPIEGSPLNQGLIFVKDDEVPLWMYGGMGNATTFLVETLYFWAIFEAIGRYLRIPAWCTAFGDDIILNTRLAQHPLFQLMTERAHVIINHDKSCYQPGVRLREACGMVAFDGQPLARLVRLQSPGSGAAARILSADIVNRLELSPVDACRNLAAELREELPLDTIYAHPMDVQTPWGHERRWDNPTIGAYLIEGDPRHSECQLRRSRYQTWQARVETLVGSDVRCYRRNLSGLEALAVIARRVRCERAGSKWRLTAAKPYSTRVKKRWINLY